MLKNKGPTPSKPFEELYMLKPASDYKNRHASILLALEATLAAFQQIEENDS
jgi:NifU-like protein involved in Fe-S cluster formation